LLFQQGDLSGARQNDEAALNARRELVEKEATAESLLQVAAVSIEEGRPSDAEAPTRKALEEFQAEKMTSQQLRAYATLARAFLQQGKLRDAQKAISLVTPIAQRTQQRDVHIEFQITSALVQAASSKSPDVEAAIRALDAAVMDAQKIGILRLVYEGTLARGEIEMTSSYSGKGRSRLAALQKESLSRGYLLIARKAAKAQ